MLVYTFEMDNGIGLLGLIWFAFVGWLMWSSKAQKETFLFYAWSTMVTIGTLHLLYLWIR